MLRTRFSNLWLVVALGLAQSAGAQTVTNTNPRGPGSLQNAVNGAAQNAVIGFSLPDGTAPSIILPPPPNDPGPLEIKVDLTIDGTGAPGLTIQSQDVREHLILDVDPDVEDNLEARLIDVNQGVGTIKLDGTLIFETVNDVTVASQIADVSSIGSGGTTDQFGTLRKEGPATLFLNAATEYSGGTTIVEGILQAKSQAVQGTIVNGATLIIDAEQLARVYRGVISDLDVDNPGAVEKVGVGAITLERAQTYSGGTLIREGTLILDSTSGGAIGALNLGSDVTLESGTTLEFKLGAGMPGTYTGTWDSAGALTLDGEDENAVLNLSQADASLRGDITVNQGVLAVQANAIGADITLRDASTAPMGSTPNGAVLRIHGAGSVARSISGLGRVEVEAGPGTLTLSGNNSYSGGTMLLSGGLQVDTNSLAGDAELATGTTLIFDQNHAGTYAGTLSGMGDVEKRGSGTVTMNGTHLLLGTLHVSAGGLSLGPTAEFAGNVTVDVGASLGGGGMLGGITTVHGSLTPLDMQVHHATFSSEAMLNFSVDVNNAHTQQLLVDGTGLVNLDPNSTVNLSVAPGDYFNLGNGVDFILINGETGATVNANGVAPQGGFAFLDISVVAGMANQYIVNVLSSIDEAGLLDAAMTPNQLSVAGALFDVIDDPAGDSVRQALVTVSASELPSIYDAAGAESVSAFTSAHLATAQRFERGLHRRVRDLRWGSRESFFEVGPDPTPNSDPGTALKLHVPSSILAAPASSNASRATPGLGVWSDAWGVLASIDGDGNSSDTTTNLAGVSLAVDGRINRHGLIGAALGYTYADLDVDGQDTTSSANGIQTAIYGGWATPQAYLSGAARFGWARNNSERDLVIGTVNGTTQADFDTLDYGVGFELGTNLARFGLVIVQPTASFDWVRIERESFSESAGGALGPLALSVDDDSIDSVQTGLGLRASLRYPLGNDSEIVPEIRARWLHEFGDDERIVRGRFRGAPAGGGAFRVAGAEIGSDIFLAGIGWSVSLGDRLRVHADYDALVSSDSLVHELSIAVRARY